MVIDSPGAAIWMLSACVADAELVSVTLTVKLAVPAVDGVPPICPPELRLRPAGNEPDDTDHVYDPEPPVACSVCEYAAPTCPSGRLAVDMAKAGGAMFSASC